MSLTRRNVLKAAAIFGAGALDLGQVPACLLYTSPSPRD